MTAFGIGRDRVEDTREIREMIRVAAGKYSLKDGWGAEGVIELVEERSRDAYGRSIVGRVVTDMLRERVGIAWQGGWQPVDLDRFVGRVLKQPERGLLGDAMAEHLTQYAASTVDPEWWDQLADLDARVWWPSDRGWVLARAERENWYGLVLYAVRLLGRLWLTPRIEQLGPAPGEATARTSERDRSDVDPRILERVRRLLAKAESTTYEAEAETFTAGAQSLMARHSIDAALLAASEPNGTSAGPGARRLGIDNPYESQKVMLLAGIATANRCRTVWAKELGHVTLIGHREDRLAVETLFTSLLVQATAAVAQQGRRTDGRGRSRTTAFRRSFLAAFAVRIAERLTQAAEAEVQAAAAQRAGPGSAQELVPLLERRREAVDAAVDEMFPALEAQRGPTITDAEGWNSGTVAADRASLSGSPEVGGRSPVTDSPTH